MNVKIAPLAAIVHVAQCRRHGGSGRPDLVLSFGDGLLTPKRTCEME